MADMKVSQMGEVLVANDNDLLNLVTYDEQNQTYVSGKVKASTMKDYMIGDTDISDLGDGTPTGAINALDGKIDDNYDEWKEQWKKNGAYNLAYHNFTTQSLNGITVTVNANKSITLNNKATASTSIHLFQTASASAVGLKEGEIYKLVGLTPTTPECYLKVNIIYNSQNHIAEDSGNGDTFTFTGTSYGDFYYDFYLIIPNGTEFNNDTIYPMITTDLNATYDDFVPHAMTNKELTEVNDVSSFFTGAPSTFTISASKCGKVVNISVAISSGVSGTKTFTAGIKPKVAVALTPSCANSGDVSKVTSATIGTDGSCSVNLQSASTGTITLYGSYIEA